MTYSPDWSDLTISLPEVKRKGAVWFLLSAVLAFVPYVWVNGMPAGLPAGAFAAGALLLVVAYVVSVPVHEALHALGMAAFAGVAWQDISFGLRLRDGIAYVHTAASMSVRAYRGVLGLPGLVLGVVPAAVGAAFGQGWVAVYGFLMLASAAGDVVMLWLMRRLPADALVRDHPTQVGCQVLVPPADPQVP